MNRALFKSFYEGNIEAIAINLVNDNLDEKGQPIFTYQPNVDGVYEEYLNQMALLRAVIKGSHFKTSEEDSLLLDGHKVAACITCSIIKIRLITYKTIEDDSNESGNTYSLKIAYRMNEQLALYSGISCLLEFMMDNPEHLGLDLTSDEKLEPIFPRTHYEERSTYLDSLIRALFYTNTFSIVNPLLLANIFFMIESYHRKSVELQEFKQSMS